MAAEFNVGQRMKSNLYLENTSDQDASALLELNVPTGIDIEVAEIGDTSELGTGVDAAGVAISPATDNVVDEAQFSATSWILIVGRDAGEGDDDGLTLIIEPQDDINPGFYTITGRIVQIRG